MAFDGIVVAGLVHELKQKLTDGRIAKIAQPEADELLLTIKSPCGQHRLLISANASLPLIYLTDTNKPSPITAPNFCMLLRKHISNSRITDISQPKLERIICFTIEHFDELGDLCQKKLIVEIMGKHSNIIFCSEDGTIIDSPAIAMKKRVGYVSKDRDVESLCLNASIEDNISIAGMSEFAINNFLILKNREKKYVNHQIEELSIKCAGRDQSVSQLSGGNKQKVVFGKWIGCGSEILILDCPTRGVDIGVKQAMYQLMVRLKNEGKSILMISEELPELIGMSDRILIMKNGEVSAEFERSETLSDAQIIEYMI